VPFSIVAGVWALAMGYIGVKGIQYVSKFSTFLNWVPLLLIIVVFFNNVSGVSRYTPPNPAPYLGFVMIIQVVVGFFATAGAAGVDFGMNSRNESDVRLGGLVGVALAILVAGGLPLMAVAGAKVLYNTPDLDFQTVIAHGGIGATAMFGLFALASIAPACVSSFIAGNSFATMIPGVPRLSSTMVGAAIAAVLAITGAAANLIGLFTIIGASFGPICGAMMADYLLAGKKWSGPREGISIAGYGAWAVGFVVGILPFLPLPANVIAYLQPAAVYSFIAGFVVYVILAKAGLQGKVVSETVATAQGASV
jgi:cytosine permease